MAKEKKGKTEKKERNQRRILSLALFIIALIVIIVVIIAGGIRLKTTQTLTTTMTQTIENAEGNPRNFKVSYSVDLEGNKVSRDEVKQTIQDTMASYSYEEMTDDNAIERLRRDVHRNLEEVVGVGKVGYIYITDFNANAPFNERPIQDGEWIERRDGIMQGIFPKYKSGN